MADLNFPISPANNDTYSVNGTTYTYNAVKGVWNITIPNTLGYTGSFGYTGSRGFTGSQGNIGYTGSRGFTGSQGNIGYTGSRGFTGSIGYTGSEATNADTVDGYHASVSAVANTVVVRDGNNHILGTYYNGSGTWPVTGSADTTGMATFTGTNGADNFGRGYTRAAAAALLGAGSITMFDDVRFYLGTNNDVGFFHNNADFYLDIENSDNWYIRDVAGGAATRFTFASSTGNFTATGQVAAASFNATSARDKKENISSFTDNALNIINNVDVVNFTFIDDEKSTPKVGFIADDVPPILSGPEQNIMDLSNTIGVLLKAIQELSTKMTELNDRIESLESK